RDDTKRRITIGFNVRNRDVESIVEEIKTKVNDNIDFPAGYYPTYGGQFQNLVEARQRLSIAVPVALLLIFILLFFTFKSVKQSILIFTAIPLSAIGGVFALYFRDMPFSISAGVGFIALFGVSVLNGIVLIAEFNRLKEKGITDLKERVLKGTEVRLRPVLMTALVASFGFLPMALSNSSGAEVQRPLATVVIGGLFTATFLTLIVLPVLYIYFEKGMKKVKINTMLLLLGIFLFPVISQAQGDSAQTLSLDAAVNMALQNNPTIKAAKQEVEWNEQMKKTSLDIGKTQFNWQHGQYNSIINNDNYFDVSQTFAFPTVYAKNTNVANANIKSSELQQAVTENELATKVKSVYYQLAYAKTNQKLLLRLDSIYVDFAKAANLRYKTGESSLLEKTTAETQLMEIRNRLKMAESDVQIYFTQLKTLLNTDNPVEIEYEGKMAKRGLMIQSDSSSYNNNPGLAYLQQQIKIQEEQQSLQKAKMMPDITLGYFNQSLIGTQTINGTEQYFGSSNRFTGFQVGIAIPIWVKPQIAKVQAAKIKAGIAESNYESYQKKLEGMYLQAVQEYIKYKNSLEYYETSALGQSELMLQNAKKGFKSGSIGYFEYVQVVNQSMAIQTAWLESLNRYNQSVIQLEYLAGIK
ncbi:MAG: efflux RND transporter permease subunit, partial [Bacteroidetes bacterium]|nr:efflux RND transporter permease subunit [Bacteroidota bacterium]